MADSEEAKTVSYNCDKSCRRNVILAYDGSEHSERAAKFYFDNVMKGHDHIFIIHAFELPPVPAAPYPYGFSYYDDWQKFVQNADDEAQKLLRLVGDDFKTKIKDMDNKPHLQLFKETGRAGEVISGFCKDVHASLLIMGSRGLGTVRRTFLGSVSDYCVHHANIPVVIVPPENQH